MVSDDTTTHAELTRCFLVLLILVTITVVVSAVVLLVHLVCHRVLRKLFLGLESPTSRLLYRDLVLLLAALAHLFLLELNDFLSVLVEVCVQVLTSLEAVIRVGQKLRLSLYLFDLVDELPEALTCGWSVDIFGCHLNYPFEYVEPDHFANIGLVVDLLENLVLRVVL